MARVVNLTWQLQRERMEREGRAVDPFTAASRQYEALEARLEALEAELFAQSERIDYAQIVADMAVERIEAA